MEDVHLVIVRILDYDISKSSVLLYFGNMTGNVVLKEDRYLLKIVFCVKKQLRENGTSQIHQPPHKMTD